MLTNRILGALCLATLALTGAANAADLAPLPPPMLRPALPPVAVVEPVGIYLRSYVGLSEQSVDRLSNSMDSYGTIQKVDMGFASAPLFGGGIGFKINRWFRADVTGEYRGRASFSGLERYTDSGLPLGYGTDDYKANKSGAIVLVNGYFDLGTWWCLTPYVGAGIGGSKTRIENYRDVNVVTNGLAYAPAKDSTGYAWALHAGVSYAITPSVSLDLAYRYLNLGDAKTGVVRRYDGSCTLCEPITFKNIESHDVMLGLRWFPGFVAAAPIPEFVPPPPVVTKY